MADEIKNASEMLAKELADYRKAAEVKDAEIAKLGKAHSETEAKVAAMAAGLAEAKAAADKAIAAASRRAQAESKGDVRPETVEHKKAFSAFLRKGADNGLAEIEAKALSLQTSTDGGYAVPEELDRSIQDLLINISPFRQLANVVQVGNSNYKKIVNKRGTASGWVGEVASRGVTATPLLAEIIPPLGEIYAFPQASQQMLDDVFFNAEAWISGEVAVEMDRAEGAAFLNGTGTNQPKGILAQTVATTDDGVRAFGSIQAVHTGVAGDWAASNKFDTLFTLVGKLKAGHRANASFITNKALLFEMAAFKDSQGRYLWQPSLQAGKPDTLLGYPVHEMEDMPAKATGSASLIFGNFKAAYTIVDRMGTRVLRDALTNKPYVGFYVTRRVGGAVIDSEAAKVLVFDV